MQKNSIRIVLTTVLAGRFSGRLFPLGGHQARRCRLPMRSAAPWLQLPALTSQSLLSGTFADRFEDYATDQFPLRDEFRTLKALTATGLLRQRDNNGLYRVGDHLAKLEYPMNTASLDHAAERFRYLYEAYLKDAGSRVYLSLIPDKNYFMAAPNGYPSIDYEQFAEELQSRTGYMQYIDIFDLLELEDYYRTDAHWRQEKILGCGCPAGGWHGRGAYRQLHQKNAGKAFLWCLLRPGRAAHRPGGDELSHRRRH